MGMREFECSLKVGRKCMLTKKSQGECVGRACQSWGRQELNLSGFIERNVGSGQASGKDAAAGEEVEERLERVSSVWSRPA